MDEKLRILLWGDVGKPILIGRPGARGTIENVEKHYAENDANVFEFVNDGSCIQLDFINEISEVRGDQIGKRSYDRIDNGKILSVGTGCDFLHRRGQSYY